MAEEPSEDENQYYQGDGQKGSLETTMKTVIQMVFSPGNGLSEPHDRVRQILGITKNQIKHPAKKKRYYIDHSCCPFS